MALPNTFAAVTAATGAQLDANFNAVGKSGPIPCTVTGTNALTLTPLVGVTPTIAAYANYLMFSGIFAATNTGALQLQIGALPLLNGYKDSPSGPAAFTGTECVQNNAFTAIYDSALNSGAGGFHVNTNTGFTGVGSLTVTPTGLNIGTSLSTLTRVLSGSGTIAYTVVPANSVQDQPFVLAGAQIADVVSLGFSSVPSGAGFTGFCGTVGTVTVRMTNPTGASIAAATLSVHVAAIGLTP